MRHASQRDRARAPVLDAVLGGDFDLVRTTHGLVLSVCDAADARVLRTFWRR